MTVDAAIVAIADFLTPFMPLGTEIIRGQTNDVPPPSSPFIELTEILQTQLSTTRIKNIPSNDTASYLMPARLDIQMDFYGKEAGDMCRIAQTMLRSLYAVEKFPDGIKPLYCNEGIQAPLITGERQFETRWSLTLSLQYNAPTVIDQEFFDQVGQTGVIPADITTPVE